ncbi:MAG: hypothetical protein ACKPA7_23470 [Sphaerospermopsis kisseleviana]
MKFSQTLGVILGTTTLAIVQYQPVSALTSVEVNNIAKPITVMIGGLDGKGSGVIVAKNGNTYTVLTANHVVKKVGYGVYEIITHDGSFLTWCTLTRLRSFSPWCLWRSRR